MSYRFEYLIIPHHSLFEAIKVYPTRLATKPIKLKAEIAIFFALFLILSLVSDWGVRVAKVLLKSSSHSLVFMSIHIV